MEKIDPLTLFYRNSILYFYKYYFIFVILIKEKGGRSKVDKQILKEQIRKKAYEIGIDKIGFTHAEPFYELEGQFKEQQRKENNSGFEHKVLK